MNKVMVLGATPNRKRFANTCVKSLIRYGYPVIPLGIKEGSIAGHEIIIKKIPVKGLHTITIYLNPENQKEYYDYIIKQEPKRIILNPGAENPELKAIAEEKGIDVIEDCTLIMLNSGKF
ncbi:MAG: CoA-binding protein [Bacteroidales bacterium]